VFCLVILFYMFCGCFMDCLSIIIITVPIVFPVLTSMGFDPIVLVMLLVFAMEIANLTPPVGMSVFYVANATNESTGLIFKNVVPYFIMDLGLVLLFGAVPGLILWLPRLLGY
jgi:TRAP-type C4-dicarboxylate transport system permease large subunit